MIARRAVMVLAVTAAAALAAWLLYHAPRSSTIPAEDRTGDVRLRLEQIEVRGRRGGEKDWDLRAESIEVPRRGGIKILKTVREAVLYRAGEPYLSMEAGEIRLDEGSRSLEVRGGLRARMGERIRFSAASADWDPDERKLTCGGPVVLELGRTRLTAPSMVCDSLGGRFVCPAGVEVRAGRNFMRADRLAVDVEDEVLAMTGHGRGRFWVGEVERLMAGDELDRALLERVRLILRSLSSGTG
jgi:hypothetical protein